MVYSLPRSICSIIVWNSPSRLKWGREGGFCLPLSIYSMTWLTVYCIGIAVGITLDNVFWYALARIKENDKENYK